MKKVLIIFLLAVLLINGGLFGLTYYLYNESFGTRYISEYKMDISRYPGLMRVESGFTSSNGQTLSGYIYMPASNSGVKGAIIISHGLGGGHISYLPHINYFVNNGYAVFAYDGTGCDDSEGKSVVGLPQAVLDLEYAIGHVRETYELSNLPIMLFGQSWGSYAVTAVLNQYPDEISAVAAVSGFPASSDMLTDQNKTLIGPLVYGIKPYTILLDFINFKSAAFYSGIKGVESSSARVLIVHSRFDPLVNYKYFEQYQDNFAVNGRVYFKSYSNRKHWVEYTPQQLKKIRSQTEYVNKELEKFKKENAAIKKKAERSTKSSIYDFPEYDQLLFEAYSDIDEDFLSYVTGFFDRSL